MLMQQSGLSLCNSYKYSDGLKNTEYGIPVDIADLMCEMINEKGCTIC
jgi:hypothetical protein